MFKPGNNNIHGIPLHLRSVAPAQNADDAKEMVHKVLNNSYDVTAKIDRNNKGMLI